MVLKKQKILTDAIDEKALVALQNTRVWRNTRRQYSNNLEHHRYLLRLESLQVTVDCLQNKIAPRLESLSQEFDDFRDVLGLALGLLVLLDFLE